jgi:Fic family protein
MFSYTSAISKKWLAIVFHGLKLGNIRNPFGHFFGHSSATLSAISYVTDRTAHRDLEKLVERGRLKGSGQRAARRYVLA